MGFGTDTLKRQLRLRIFLKDRSAQFGFGWFFAFSQLLLVGATPQERFSLLCNLAATIPVGAVVTIRRSSFGKLASGTAY